MQTHKEKGQNNKRKGKRKPSIDPNFTKTRKMEFLFIDSLKESGLEGREATVRRPAVKDKDNFDLGVKSKLSELFNKFEKEEETKFGKRHPLEEYNMGSNQSAKTKMQISPEDEITVFTNANMHSEMAAIEEGFKNYNFKVNEDGTVNNQNIIMYTKLPHCRFCSFFLPLLGIERSHPTLTNHKYSGVGYPLPDQIKYNLNVLNKTAAILGLTNFDMSVYPILKYSAAQNSDFRYFYPINRKTTEGQRDGTQIYTKDEAKEIINIFWNKVFKYLDEAETD